MNLPRYFGKNMELYFHLFLQHKGLDGVESREYIKANFFTTMRDGHLVSLAEKIITPEAIKLFEIYECSLAARIYLEPRFAFYKCPGDALDKAVERAAKILSCGGSPLILTEHPFVIAKAAFPAKRNFGGMSVKELEDLGFFGHDLPFLPAETLASFEQERQPID